MDIVRDSDLNYDNDVDCSRYDPRKFRSTFVGISDKFFVFHQNIRSFNKNCDELLLFMNGLDVCIDVVILSETWFNEDNCYDIPGYKSYHSYRKDRGGGGISIYVSAKLKSKIISDICVITPVAEFCGAAVSLSASVTINVIGFYRPPGNSTIEQFCNFYENSILSKFSPSQMIVAGGDANINLLSSDGTIDPYTDLMYSNCFLPCITLPTRVTSNTQTIIDHIWSNIISNVKSGVFENDITDHYTIFTCILDRRSVKTLVARKFRDCSEMNVSKLKERLSLSLAGFHIYDSIDIDLKTQIFLDVLYNVYNECCPVKTKLISISRLNKPWFDDDLRRLCDMKHGLFRRYKANEVSFSEYSYFKNKFTALLRRSKVNYFRDKFDRCKGNIRMTWRNINDVMGRGKRADIDKIIQSGESFEDDYEIACRFNQYFSSVAGELREAIPDSDASPLGFLGARSVDSLDFDHVTVSEVKTVIRAMPNKSGKIDSVPVFIFKKLEMVISPIICRLFNCSLIEKKFPSALKLAEVVPVHKSGSPYAVANYRPISILPVLSKIFEKIMRARLIEFLAEYNILCDHQFGFRAGRETSDAILEFLDHAYNSLDSKSYLISVFLDLSKAFDTLDHDILLSKLEHVEVRGVVLEWFSSYLSDRRQVVGVNGTCSSVKPMNTGVPQGSVLGPLLFLIYINDMSLCSKRLHFIHFADDTTVFRTGNDIMNLMGEVNTEFRKVDDWLIANKLSLNLTKSTFMVISHSNIPSDLSLSVRNHNLSRVNFAKFLGVLIDDRLTFKCQIGELSNKLSKSVGILYKLSHYVPPSTLKSLYFSLCHFLISYGITAWGSSASTHLSRVVSLQNRAVRTLPMIGNVNNFSSYNILKINDLYKYFCCVKLFKCFREDSHKHFYDCFNKLIPDHSHNTRHKANGYFNVPICHKTRSQRSFIYVASNFWNEIPLSTRNLPQLSIFKRTYKASLVGKYSSGLT